MSYRVEVSASACRQFARLDTLAQTRIRERIRALADNPYPAGCVKLQGREGAHWRMRVGDYRVIYTVDHAVLYVLVTRIGHRREVYR